MRRLFVLGLLVLCVGAVAYLLLATGSNDRASSRRLETAGETGVGEDVPDEAEAGAVEGGGATAAATRDDDPNRVPGADLLLRGKVVRDER